MVVYRPKYVIDYKSGDVVVRITPTQLWCGVDVNDGRVAKLSCCGVELLVRREFIDNEFTVEEVE